MLNTHTPKNTTPETLACKSNHSQSALALQLKAAADPLRLDILRVMASGSFGVLELCRLFTIKQSGMSHHLKVLTNADWITSRREGNSIFYRRANLNSSNPQARLQQQLFDTLDAQPLESTVAAGIDTIQTERGNLSQRFFSDNADKFREQQDLIASYPVYAEQVLELIDATSIAHGTNAKILEVGPGEGECLLSLGKRFSHVTALDNAKVMLEKAKQTTAGQSGIHFMHGDTGKLKQTHCENFDAIVVNMVLHHTPNPREIFSDLSALLHADGVLFITDLCRHDQSWVRDTCGDLWQGFEPEDFTTWADESHLREGQAIYFALRNGFQIQVRQFFKNSSKETL